MKFSTVFTAIVCIGLASSGPSHPRKHYSYGGASKNSPNTVRAVYFQTNDATKNDVIALSVGSDGSITGAECFPTGGRGSSGVDGNRTSHADALFSQDAVRVGDNYLFAVNAGDNSVSMFNIRQDGSLQRIGRPASTLGEFPVSVAYSSKLKQVCVLNGGSKDGVACFRVDPRRGLRTADRAARPLNIGQSTPVNGPLGSASDIFFNQGSTALMVTVKGDPTMNNAGFVAAYPVQNGRVSDQAVMSSPDGTAVLFGSAVSGSNKFLSTDASFGYSMLSLNQDLSVQSDGNFKIDGQGATCWAAFSKSTGSFYVTDVKVNRIVEADGNTGEIVGMYNLTNGNPGNIDNQVGGDFLYNLSPLEGEGANGRVAVAVMDLTGGKGNAKEMQTYTIQGAGISSMGMAVFPAL